MIEWEIHDNKRNTFMTAVNGSYDSSETIDNLLRIAYKKTLS